MKHLILSQTSYFIHIETALIVSITIFILLFKINIYPTKTVELDRIVAQHIIEVENTIQTKHDKIIPPPPKPVVPVEVPNDEIIEDEIIFMDSDLNIGEFNQIIFEPPPQEKQHNEEEDIFIVVEQPPTLIGGINQLQKKIVYPEFAKVANTEGRVIVQFIVDAAGNVKNPFVVRGIGSGCDEEALRVIKEAKFNPGLQRGKPVSVQYTIPIIFKLREG